MIYNNYSYRREKHLQCGKLLGLAGGNIKKRGSKKSGESVTPIRYNVIHMYIFARYFSLIISLVVSHAIWWFSKPFQCEKLLGLAGGNTKKRGNKKSSESITPIRYNVMNALVLVHYIYKSIASLSFAMISSIAS